MAAEMERDLIRDAPLDGLRAAQAVEAAAVVAQSPSMTTSWPSATGAERSWSVVVPRAGGP